jgi:hypothetical protein
MYLDNYKHHYNKLQKNCSKIHSYEKTPFGEKKHAIFFYNNFVGSFVSRLHPIPKGS